MTQIHSSNRWLLVMLFATAAMLIMAVACGGGSDDTSEAEAEVLGMLIFEDPIKSTSVLSLLLLVIFVEIKFIFGDPINPPTKRLFGSLYRSIGDPFCETIPSSRTTISFASGIASV